MITKREMKKYTKPTDEYDYYISLPDYDQALFNVMAMYKCLPGSITYYKDIIRALNIAQRRERWSFTKTGGKFFNCQKMRDEIQRLLSIKPLNMGAIPDCDHCNKPVCWNDQALSYDGSLCIHVDCDNAWEKCHGKPFPSMSRSGDSDVDW